LQEYYEVNFDGLPGPYHNYGGLARGNLASMAHGKTVSNPLKAALQVIDKMKILVGLGVEQAVIPPHERPHLGFIKSRGFMGSEADIISEAHGRAPQVLASAYSSSCMWAANSATVSPSPDTIDGKLHLTPANMPTFAHRAMEAKFNYRYFLSIFPESKGFRIHPPLPAAMGFSDEGAANHVRLSPSHGEAGLEIFVYGKACEAKEQSLPKMFPARQTLEASKAIAGTHGLTGASTLFIKQSARSIDRGVFHNDVVCVGNENILLVHEEAFEDFPEMIGRIKAAYRNRFGETCHIMTVSSRELSIEEAVQTYLFNSQLISLPNGETLLVAPLEARENKRSYDLINRIIQGAPKPARVIFVDIRQSMKNGGGPACLRLRAVMSRDQLMALNQGVRMNAEVLASLERWVKQHYRDRLSPDDLADPSFIYEIREALDQLSALLGLRGLYPFQM
jgi:succinylarginine dihydrolase